MGADNKAVVRRIFEEVVNAGRLEVVDELFDPSYTADTGLQVLDRNAFKGFVEGWRSAFPDLHCEVSEMVAEGDAVAWSVRATGTHRGEFLGIPATGRTIDFDSMNVAHFRDGRAVRHRVLMDGQTMMAQLGVGQGSDLASA
jgi:steroid delta-isomerase-like uncharacterized protein